MNRELGTVTYIHPGFQKCCSYGTSGSATEGYDCLVIPGAKKTMATTGKTASQLCGNLIVTVSGMMAATSICCELQIMIVLKRHPNS